MSSKKEIFSFVPQEISRHFIEPTQATRDHQNEGTICIKQITFNTTSHTEDDITEEEEEEEEYSQKDVYDDDATVCASEEEEEEYTEDEEEEEGNASQSLKWSFVRGLLSKLHLRTEPSTQTPNVDATRYLSLYGTLQSKRIGEGVSATVQLTQRGEETFAVKIFRKKKRSENLSGYMKLLAGEFCISSALHHPNIIKTLDLVRMDEDHSRYCIVMEYCPEGDMYALIKQGKTQDDQMYSYFKQLLLGLEYLHSLGVAHRDLKPENLLISQGLLKIADFGSADVFRVAWQDHSRLSDGLCGTTPYMAPEIFLDQGYWAAPVDVWAAGIIFFCMRFDGVPFGSAQKSDPNYPIYLRKRLLRQYQPFNKFAHDPRTLIYAMLNPEPNRRVTVPDILSMPWMQSVPSHIQF